MELSQTLCALPKGMGGGVSHLRLLWHGNKANVFVHGNSRWHLLAETPVMCAASYAL